MKHYFKYYFCCLITLSFLFVVVERAEATRTITCSAGGPYVVECAGATTDVTLQGSANVPNAGFNDDTFDFAWTSDCPGASFDDDTSETPTLTVDTSSLGCPTDCTVTLDVTDQYGNTASCSADVTIEDTTDPVISCNVPATITPPDAPISFTATATDDCTTPTVQITGFECFAFTKKGKRIDKSNSCDVYIGGASPTINIIDTGGVGTHIKWTVLAQDACGNETLADCEVLVVNPGRGTGP